MCKEHQLQWIPLAGYSSQTYLVMSVMSREAGLILIMECRLSWVCATTLGGKNHFCIRHVFELLKQKLQTWEDNVLHLLFHYLTFARITPEDMKPQYTGAKWIEATLKAASIHFVDVWLHLRSQGEPGKRCGATILGIALGAPLEIHHCNSATPSAASIMVCQDRKSFGKRHEFWRRKCISDTSVAPVVLLNLRWFIPIPEAMRTANPSSSFWGEILPSSSWDCPGRLPFVDARLPCASLWCIRLLPSFGTRQAALVAEGDSVWNMT